MWYNHIYNDTTINTTIQPYILRYNHIYNDTNIYTTIQPYIQWYNHIYYDTTIYTTIQPYIQWYNHIYYDTTIYTMIQPYILRYNHIYNDTTIYTMQSVSYSLLSRAFPKANYLVSVPLQQYMVSKAPPRSGGLCVFSWNFTLSNSLRQTIVSRPRSSYHYDFTCSCERSTHVADSRLAISWLCAVRWRYRLCLHCWPMHDSSEITFNTKTQTTVHKECSMKWSLKFRPPPPKWFSVIIIKTLHFRFSVLDMLKALASELKWIKILSFTAEVSFCTSFICLRVINFLP